VLGVGRFSEEKGFDILVKAWAKVIRKEPNARLTLVGEGQDLPMLKTLAQQLGISATISFEGNRDNVFDYFARADVFVLPSRNEGMSNALLEAMAMGKACIASDIPANRSVLTPEVDGLMFKKNDSDELADLIVYLLHEPYLRKKLGANARDKIIARFSIDIIAKLYIQLYSQLAVSRHLKT
jgi:glycosyltransferase involved in cell wall biosynthesis